MADSLLDLIVRRATTSLVPQAKQGYDMMADQVDPGPSLSDADHPYKAMARGGFAGMLNGLGNLADQTTSPLGLASMAAGPGRGIMSRLLSAGRPAAAAVATEAPMAAKVAQGISESGKQFVLPQPRAIPQPARMAELYQKFGMEHPDFPGVNNINLEQILAGR